MGGLRFGVYEKKLVYDTDKLIRRQLIVLKDQDGDIVAWTDFHKYARLSLIHISEPTRPY